MFSNYFVTFDRKDQFLLENIDFYHWHRLVKKCGILPP